MLREKLNHPIGRKILFAILICSSILTILLSAGQLYLDYKINLGDMNTRIDSVKNSDADSLSEALWNYDAILIQTQLDGLSDLPDIKSITIVSSDNEKYRSSNADIQIEYPYLSSFDLTHKYKGKDVVIGVVNIIADKKGIYDKLIQSLVYIISSHAIKTFVISSFILFIIYQLIIKRINLYTQHARDILNAEDMEKIDSIAFNEKENKDELSELIYAVDAMKNGLVEKVLLLKNTEKELQAQATTDALTGIKSRRAALESLIYMINVGKRSKMQVAVLYIDLDDFKQINDYWGSQVGDEVLKVFCRGMNEVTRTTDMVGRLAGDLFIIALADIESKLAVDTFLAKLYSKIAEPLNINNNEITLKHSIGISIYPKDGDDLNQLLKNADTALQESKSERKGERSYFNAGMNEVTIKRDKLSRLLTKGINDAELTLHYQPITNVKTNKIYAIEALVRWNSSEMGLVSTDAFIAVAEFSGQIHDIGRFIVKESLKQLNLWKKP
jgi:diguanylate cyclase (GGDEF)-like protein